jgi:hypothetical protein
VPLDPGAEGFGLVPLVEPLSAFATTYPSAYPANIYGETPHTAMAGQISSLARSELGRVFRSVHSVVGENGQGMNVIEKGAAELVMGATSTGRAYAATLFEAAVIARIAREQGLSYGVGAVIITHGEADASNTNYGDELIQLRQDDEHHLRGGHRRGLHARLRRHHRRRAASGRDAALGPAARLGPVRGLDHRRAQPNFAVAFELAIP